MVPANRVLDHATLRALHAAGLLSSAVNTGIRGSAWAEPLSPSTAHTTKQACARDSTRFVVAV
jgi:hypothetical protein